ncbi:MAG: hypothetical protein ACO30L_07970, partial [Ilumatobacteraceae bacterium]
MSRPSRPGRESSPAEAPLPRANSRVLGVSAALVLVVMVVVALVLESRATPETSVQVVPTTSTTAAPVMLPPITRSLKDGDEG